MKYTNKTENQERITLKVMVATQEYFNCKKDVDEVALSIKKFTSSIDGVLTKVIKDNTDGQLQKEYKHCLKQTIMIALGEVDNLIQQHHITSDEEIECLREAITNLQDDVDELFNQG